MDKPSTYVQMIGSFSITVAGRRLTLHRVKERALVAFLCTNKGRKYRREYLVDLLWPNVDTPKGRHSLNQALYAIRRILPDLIVTDEISVSSIRNHFTTDTETLADCLCNGDPLPLAEMITGAFLGDIEIPNCKPFDEWRDKYHADLFLHVEQAVLKSVRALPPEARTAELMRWRSQAIDLLPALHCVYPTQRHRDNEGRVSDDSTAVDLRKGDVAASDRKIQMPLVGRTDQMAVLASSYINCLAGNAEFVVVSGQAGHGKTRLVSDFIEKLAPKTKVYRIRCYESERRIGFGPIGDLLSRFITAQDLVRLEPVWSGALKQLTPGLPSGTETPPRLSAVASQSRFFEAVLRLFEHISGSEPVILFVDDMQWCDRSTRTLLAYLSHRLRSAQLMVIACTRTRTSKHALNAALQGWRHIKVGELGRSDLSALLDQLHREHGFRTHTTEELSQLTGGHPYLVSEVTASGLGKQYGSSEKINLTGHTSTVDQFVGAMLRSIPSPAQRIVAALAVLARPASPRIIRAVSKIKDVARSIDSLVAHELVTVVNGRIGLRHDLVREAAYRRIPMFSRTEIHRRAAEALRHNRKNAGQTALHYYKARERTLAYEHAVKAVDQADARHANEESIFFVRLAMKALPKRAPELRTSLAERLHRAHRLSEARIELRPVLEQRAHPIVERLGLELFDLELGYALGEVNGTTIRQRLATIKGSTDPRNTTLMLRALRLQIRSAYNDGAEPVIAESIRQIRVVIGDLRTPEALEGLFLAARVMSGVYSSVAAQEWVERVTSELPSIADHEAKVRVMASLADISYESGNLVAAETLMREALDVVQAVGAMNMWPLIAAHIHMLLVEQGMYDEAHILYLEAKGRAENLEAIHTVATLCANQAAMLFDVGDLERAKETVAQAFNQVSRAQAVWIQLELHGLDGLIALEQGKLAAANESAAIGKSKLKEFGTRVADLSLLEILIARTDTLMGHRAEALTRLREAIWDYRERDVVCRLRMQLELARMLKVDNKKEARQIATEVFTLARSINARPIAERAESLLQRL